jgi:predicted HAD superfamily phosphohydrolase YqeG
MAKRGTVVIREPNDVVINAIKDDNSHEHGKTRLYLDVDGTLVAMKFDPTYMSNPEGP